MGNASEAGTPSGAQLAEIKKLQEENSKLKEGLAGKSAPWVQPDHVRVSDMLNRGVNQTDRHVLLRDVGVIFAGL